MKTRKSISVLMIAISLLAGCGEDSPISDIRDAPSNAKKAFGMAQDGSAKLEVLQDQVEDQAENIQALQKQVTTLLGRTGTLKEGSDWEKAAFYSTAEIILTVLCTFAVGVLIYRLRRPFFRVFSCWALRTFKPRPRRVLRTVLKEGE